MMSKEQLVFLCVFLVSLGACVTSLDDDDTDAHWEIFKLKYNRGYATEEEESNGRENFEKNMLHAVLHNMEEQSFEKEVNRFSDMDPSEVIKMLCKTEIPEEDLKQERVNFVSSREVADEINWVDQGKTSPVKDQGQCGACWAFAAIQGLESQIAIQRNQSVVLSPQQLVDCSVLYSNMGCAGGYPDKAYKYMERNGILEESCYPYTGKSGFCRSSQNCEKYTMSSFKPVEPKDENALKQAVAEVGPVSVAIYAPNSMVHYKSGVFQDKSCKGRQANHAVLVVGYGSEKGQDYWLVKNSWGKDWGDEGFIKMARNMNNMCSIASHPTYPVI